MSEPRFYVGDEITVRGNDRIIRTIIDLATRDNGTEYAVLHGPLCGECVTLDRLTHGRREGRSMPPMRSFAQCPVCRWSRWADDPRAALERLTKRHAVQDHPLNPTIEVRAP